MIVRRLSESTLNLMWYTRDDSSRLVLALALVRGESGVLDEGLHLVENRLGRGEFLAAVALLAVFVLASGRGVKRQISAHRRSWAPSARFGNLKWRARVRGDARVPPRRGGR